MREPYSCYICKSQSVNNYKYISIYYKKMKTEWVLKSYSLTEADAISKKILKKTKNTKYINRIKSFICKNKNDINIIYKILYEDYYKTRIKYNLIEQSLKNFIFGTNEWKTFD